MPQLQQLKRAVIVPGQQAVIEDYEEITGTEAEAIADQQANQATETATAAEISDLAANIATAVQWLNQIDSATPPAAVNLATIQQMFTAIQRVAVIERRLLKLVARQLAGAPVP